MDGSQEEEQGGINRGFLEMRRRMGTGTGNHVLRTRISFSSCRRTSEATAIPLWGAPSPDSCESQDPVVMSLHPGGRALQLPGGVCFLLLT